MAWTVVQSAASSTQITTFGSALTTGNVAVVGCQFRDSVGNVGTGGGETCVDENAKSYTQVPNSPSTKIDRGTMVLFYRIIAGGEGVVCTLDCVNGATMNIFQSFGMEFAPPSGTVLFDNSAKGNGTAAASTFAINAGQGAPSIPCSGSDCLFVNVMDGNPATPGAGSPWVRNPAEGGGANAGMAYILTAGSAQEVLWTGIGVNQFTIVGASFKIPGVTVGMEWQSPKGDPIPQGWRPGVVSYSRGMGLLTTPYLPTTPTLQYNTGDWLTIDTDIIRT